MGSDNNTFKMGLLLKIIPWLSQYHWRSGLIPVREWRTSIRDFVLKKLLCCSLLLEETNDRKIRSSEEIYFQRKPYISIIHGESAPLILIKIQKHNHDYQQLSFPHPLISKRRNFYKTLLDSYLSFLLSPEG